MLLCCVRPAGATARSGERLWPAGEPCVPLKDSMKSHASSSPSAIACPCAGDGFSPRAEDAVLHGCLPVVVMDDVDPVFSSLLDWDSFSVRIPEVSPPTSASHGCSQTAVVALVVAKSCEVSLMGLAEASGWPHDWHLHQGETS